MNYSVSAFCVYCVCFFFLGPRGLEVGRLTTPFLKCVSSKRSKKTINPNPSPIGNGFGLYWFGAGGGGRTRTSLRTRDFELFASHRIQTNSTPSGGRRRTPKSPQLLTILKLMCKKAPFRLPFPYFSILTGILDFGGTSEGCNPKTEHNSTRNRFIKHKHIIACSSAIDNIFFKKEVSL